MNPARNSKSSKRRSATVSTVSLSVLILVSLSFPVFAQPAPSPENPVLIKAGLLYKAGNATSAKAVYDAYLQKNPSSAQARIGLATIARRNYDFDTARTHLETALSQHPEDPAVAAEIGHLYHLWSTDPFAKNPASKARAEEHLKQAAALNPNHPVVLTYLGEWAIEQDDRLAADANFTQALKLRPKFIPALHGFTRLSLKIGNTTQARNLILQAMELDPNNGETYYLMAQLMKAADHPEKSTEYALKSEQLDFGKHPARDLFLAKEFDRLGDVKQATSYYERVRAYDSTYVPAVAKLSKLYRQSGQAEKSMAFTKKLIELDPQHLPRLIQGAKQSLQAEQTSQSISQWRYILELDPTNTDGLHAIATAHFLDQFYMRTKPEQLQKDMALFDQLTQGKEQTPLLIMDRLKLSIAAERTFTPAIRSRLEMLAQSQDDLAAGEALFLLGDYAKALERLDYVEAADSQGYLQAANRLAMDQELIASAALYQRGYRLEPLPGHQLGLQRIQAKQRLAEKRVTEGNALLDNKDLKKKQRRPMAIQKYQEATRIYHQWEIPYMRMGDTYERMKNKPQAYLAFEKAVKINPGLLQSKGFAKKYGKLKKAYDKSQKSKSK
ncbi:MAG: tetratricopeptide repeat protein [Vampirovibrio sp.]|nr:tetratricopeptide repeat protein [Vampirovibrio sp.]